jgi:hypothetical protein
MHLLCVTQKEALEAVVLICGCDEMVWTVEEAVDRCELFVYLFNPFISFFVVSKSMLYFGSSHSRMEANQQGFVNLFSCCRSVKTKLTIIHYRPIIVKELCC